VVNVTFVANEYTPEVEAQLVRDLMLLSGRWDVALIDEKHEFSDEILNLLELHRAAGKPDFCLLYKTTDEWPEAPDGCPVFERDLCPTEEDKRIHLDPKVGFYLRPQGKGVTNRTEFYLNRARPRGQGVVNPLVTLLFG
jgi:hypothetical protein